MKIISTVNEMQSFILNEKKKGLRIGFVPTMGALHQGHISLISKSKSEMDITVASIFVNPTQFNDPKDFDKYPRTTAIDTEILTASHCDVLFLPDVAEMYQNPILEVEDFDIGFLDTILEGKNRPGHYKGVVKIVEKLFKSVLPDNVYMGLKDFQQVKVIEKLVLDKKLPIKIIGCPTLRESNGLAMSSRNMRLSNQGREDAGIIFKAFNQVKNQLCVSNPQDVLNKVIKDFFSTNMPHWAHRVVFF